jgi:hypothetical protein
MWTGEYAIWNVLAKLKICDDVSFFLAEKGCFVAVFAA